MPKAPWRLVLLSYPCPTCGAKPGEPCITTGGRVAAEHADRARNADRCPKCGIWVGAEEDPGTLCGRCALVRSLEIERATTWKRLDP
jgi:DNA-directed RNA polymerase subunit RPC12/RpoP